jgi:hypothetical protein
MKSLLALALGLVVMAAISVRADDWKTTDGKVYQNVKVVKTEPDAVTILFKDGGALVPLTKLPADLQKRFHYDPTLAQAAAQARAKADAANAKALQAEMDRAAQQQQALLTAQNPNTDFATPPSVGSVATTGPLDSPPDVNHHTMDELVDINVKLRWDHSYGDGHYSMGALLSPSEPLTPDADPKHHTMDELF